MATAPHPRVDVTAVGLAAADSVTWRHQGRLRVSVIVKATFALVHGAEMTPVKAEEILRAEVHHNKNPARSVRLTDDLAPFLWRADVMLTGHAYAPAGAPVEAMAVRLAVLRNIALLDKTIHVRGQGRGGAKARFDRVPIMYERAYGGIGFDENPLGTGAGPSAEEPPSLFDPADPRKIACLAPLSRAWPSRRRLVGKEDRKGMEAAVAEIPAQLDWAYFQAAPLDQRIDYLLGDERLVLDGLHPTQPRVDSRLPTARAHALVYGLPAGGQVLTLVADTLRIDADAMVCSVTWRGSFPLPDEGEAQVRILAGVETAGRPIAWPSAVPDAAKPGAANGADGAEDVTDLALSMSSVDIGDEPSTPAPARAPDWGATVTLETGDVASAGQPAALPFREGPPGAQIAATPRPAPPSDEEFGFGTLATDDPVDAPPSLPFQRVRPPATAALRALPAPAPVVEIVGEPALRAAPRAPRPSSTEGVALVNATPLALAAFPWGVSPSRDCFTVLAKATCKLVPGEAAVVSPSAEITAADRAPFKVRADVVLIGHACAPAGPVAVMEVGFDFGAEGNAFARRLRVSGDRRWEAGGPFPRPSAPEPFVRMPLAWERAFGGPGFEANPAGIGHADAMRRARREPVPLPNLEDAGRLLRTITQTPAPACFAPVPLAWKDRAAPRKSPHLPEDFDWTRYQSAPAAQQLAFLHGDEPFAIAGCHPRHPALTGALPGLRARCFSRIEGRFEEIPVRLDTVVIDADALTLHLLWRGALGVPDERAPGIQAIYLMTERTGDPPATLDEARERLSRS
jgi:hypothetical protein